MFKKLITLILIVILSGLLLLGCGLNYQSKLETEMKTFSSETELVNLIKKFNNNTYRNSRSNDLMAAEDSAQNTEKSGNDDYSRTNTQVEGIDEGDIVKVDGNYIYKLHGSGLIIVSANNGMLEEVKKITIENYVPQELYILDQSNKLILIGGIYKQLTYTGRNTIEPMLDCMYFSYSDTDIRIYDISDRANPVLERQITLSGYYYTSRLIDNKFYFMLNYHFYYGNEDKYIPYISDSAVNGGEYKKMPLENIYYYESIPYYGYLIMGYIDVNEPQVNSDLRAYLGLGGEIYVSENNIYVASADYSYYYRQNLLGTWVSVEGAFAKTRIVKISLSDLKQKAITVIDGTIKDRYSLDEYNGYLRAATTVNIWNFARRNDNATNSPSEVNNNIYNNVFVLDGDLKIAGKIENIAPGEMIYSVRFKGNIGSLVTFELIDPYFTLDLADPYNPKITHEHKEDGVSFYLHYLGDSGLTIGVGRDTAVQQTSWGDRVNWMGIKVSLYNTNEGKFENIETIILGNNEKHIYGYSDIFYNPKALLYDEGRGLFAFPVQIWTYKEVNNWHYRHQSMQQGLAVFKFDIDNQTLEYRGLLTNLEEDVDLNNWEKYYYDYWSFINRGVRIGDYIYTISERYITSYNIDTLSKTDRLEMPASNMYNYFR